MEQVIVKVRGAQTNAVGETGVIETVAKGRHYYKDGRHYIMYDEDMDGLVTSTMLTVAPASLRLSRSGAVTTEQIFTERTESVSEYLTPYGSMKLSVLTDSLRIEYGNVSGSIQVNYALAVNGQIESDNELSIEIMAADKSCLN